MPVALYGRKKIAARPIMEDIFFVSTSTGFMAGGENGSIRKRTDGGLNRSHKPAAPRKTFGPCRLPMPIPVGRS